MNGERADEMTVFVRAVELGGFSAAARALSLTPSAVSKSISRLEDRLGVRLLNRTTRSLTTTPEGDTFLDRSRRILADIEEAEQEITRFRSAPRGLLRLHVSVAFGLHQLPPVLPKFMQRYPEVQIDITMNDREPDFAEEGIEFAYPTQTTFTAAPDGTLVMPYAAAPAGMSAGSTTRGSTNSFRRRPRRCATTSS